MSKPERRPPAKDATGRWDDGRLQTATAKMRAVEIRLAEIAAAAGGGCTTPPNTAARFEDDKLDATAVFRD